MVVGMDIYSLHNYFEYDAKRGVLLWKVDKGAARIGDVAGKIKRGRLVVKVDGREHQVHRLVWSMHNPGEPVPGRLSPKDGDWTNTKIDNLEGVVPCL